MLGSLGCAHEGENLGVFVTITVTHAEAHGTFHVMQFHVMYVPYATSNEMIIRH